MAIKKSSFFEGFGVYIHFPFCVKKCIYCDFTSFVSEKALYKKYFSYLKDEIDIFVNKFPESSKKCVETLYIGGGTPSLIPPELLSDFFQHLKAYFDFSNLVEFTLEANPESIEKGKFEEFKSLGVNRVSMGIQSFNDESLRLLGRVHNSKEAIEKFGLLRSIGYENINIDLIFALPNETFDMQMQSLKQAISLNPEHISYYSLMVERGTPLNNMRKGLNFPNEETWLKEFINGKRILEEAQFIHYEISNYAKKSYECLHNIKYWRNFPYFGFGVSAGGFFNNVRYVNVKTLDRYFHKINEGKLPFSFRKRLSSNELKSEFIMMGLRLLDGIYFEDYYYRFGSFLQKDFEKEIMELKELKLLKVYKNKIALTKKGVQYANVVFRKFI